MDAACGEFALTASGSRPKAHPALPKLTSGRSSRLELAGATTTPALRNLNGKYVLTRLDPVPADILAQRTQEHTHACDSRSTYKKQQQRRRFRRCCGACAHRIQQERLVQLGTKGTGCKKL